jgi:hypothetical protein
MQIARRGQSLPEGSVVRHSKIVSPITGVGHSGYFGDVRGESAHPPIADVVLQHREWSKRAGKGRMHCSNPAYSITSCAHQDCFGKVIPRAFGFEVHDQRELRRASVPSASSSEQPCALFMSDVL